MHALGRVLETLTPTIVLSGCLWSAGCSRAGFLLAQTHNHTQKHAHRVVFWCFLHSLSPSLSVSVYGTRCFLLFVTAFCCFVFFFFFYLCVFYSILWINVLV